MEKGRNLLKRKAVVLLVAAAMIFSIIPAVTVAETEEEPQTPPALEAGPFVQAKPRGWLPDQQRGRFTGDKVPYEGGGSLAGFGADQWYYVHNGAAHDETLAANSIALTGAGTLYTAFVIDLSGEIGNQMTKASYCDYQDGTGAGLTGRVKIYEAANQADPYSAPAATPLTTEFFTTTDSGQFEDITLTDPVMITVSYYWIVFEVDQTAGYQFVFAVDSGPMHPGGGKISLDGVTWENLADYGFNYNWLHEVYVASVGPPPEECIPNVCDFAIAGINQQYMYEGKINSLPKIINITIANKGEIGISELKLFADIYKKICGPTVSLYDNPKYNLQNWETDTAANWTIVDDGDGDTWVLQGGPENRWYSQNQAWRCTLGKYRSPGGDEDTYLGRCDTCTGTDDLIFAPTDPKFNDISGAACAAFSFKHWCEGEYTFDADGNVIPVDYGTISFSIDNGATWTDVPISQFVAYDTEGEWQDVTLKIINTNVYNDTEYPWEHPYKVVCEGCAPQEGEIVYYMAFPDDARLQVSFSWHKDPCVQYEGWYIDDVKLERTEDYELELVFQTHDILELPPCVDQVEWMYYEFPLNWDPEPDTWYLMVICGQVFSPAGCEVDTENNCVYSQFMVTDIHDVMCKDMELNSSDMVKTGDSVTVNMTVKNIGTFAEENIPVVLKVADKIVDRPIDDDFETDPGARWLEYYFIGFLPESPWRWTKGDASIDHIYTTEPAQARSKLPGSESIICADQGALPYLKEGIGCLLSDGNMYDFTVFESAELTFYAKWSLEIELDMWGNPIPGSEGARAGLWVHPETGPDSGFWWLFDFGAWYHGGVYYNDWQKIEIDMKDLQDAFTYKTITGVEITPRIEFGWGVITDVADGECGNPRNPVPWNGIMLDNIRLETLSCALNGKVVANATIPMLAPGDEYTVQLTWSNAEYGHHCLIGDVNLPGDVDTTNDQCHVNVRVSDFIDCFSFQSRDLTGEGTCLWHLCTTREGGDDIYAWAGVEEEHWAHYIHDMDDSFISPPVDLSMCTTGAALNFTTWYKFYNKDDFGKVYVRANPGDSWKRIGTFMGDSGGVFEQVSLYIPPGKCTETTQVKFRMVSDPADTGYGVENDVSEGWYIDDVCLVNVTDYIPGAKCDFSQYDLGVSFVPYSDTNQGYWIYDEMDCLSGPITIDELKVYGLDVTNDNPMDSTWVISTADSETDSAYGDYSVMATPTSATIVDILWGAYNIWEITFTGLGLYADTTYKYLCVADTGANTLFAWMPEVSGTHDDHCYQVPYASRPFDVSWYFELPGEMVYAETIWCDDFERDTIAPWTCLHTAAGDYWHYETEPQTTPNGEGDYDYDPCCPCTRGWWEISGYPSEGKGLNDVLWTTIDLTDPLITYARLHFAMDYDFVSEEAIIEMSTDWEPGTPMKDATWVPYWHHTPGDRYGDNTGGWVTIDELVEDDRFEINQYLGSVVYLRFRLVTPGEGAGVGAGWAIDGFTLEFRRMPEPPDDEAPVTTLYFDPETAEVTLVAYDLPLDKNSGVKATYFILDGGDTQTYTGPFTIPEGTHTVEYWSEDNAGNVETRKTAILTVDTTPPTVEIVKPEAGKLYLFGSPIMNRLFSDVTLCIGKVPIEATADDGEGTGVRMVLFIIDNETAFDDTAPYTYTYRQMHFGDLTITAVAMDNRGLLSAPAEMTIKVYSLGLF